MMTAASRFPELSSGVLAFSLLAANLRPALTSVGPLLAAIRSNLGRCGAEAGLLITLPLLIFAGCSPLAGLANMSGEERTLAQCILLMALGSALQSQAAGGEVPTPGGKRIQKRAQIRRAHAPECNGNDVHIMAAGMCPRYHSSAARGSVTGQTRGT
jgi:hypothetical protein